MTSLRTTSRRSFLIEAGTVIALPYLESLAAAEPRDAEAPADAARLVFLGAGYGFTNETFFPSKPGKWSRIGLPPGMAPLKAHQDDLTMVGNLANGKAYDPHFGSTNFLTGVDTIGVAGKDFSNGISCDQVAAEALGKDTRYASLRVTLANLYENNGHGRGLSMSWDRAGNPLPGVTSMLDLYHALFANQAEDLLASKRRLQDRRSVLDLMELNGKSVELQISHEDRAKLDEYFQSVRQAELALGQEEQWLDRPKPAAPSAFQAPPVGENEIRLAYELIALALQTDATRVITYMMPNKALLASLGHPFEPHVVSHYTTGSIYYEPSQQREKKHSELLARFLDRLKEKKDTKGRSLFDSTIVGFGTNLRWGHVMKGMPLILAGGAWKNRRRGEYVELPKEGTPIANVWLTLLRGVGVKAESFGQSTGIMPELLQGA